jgi:hypothetical protein
MVPDYYLTLVNVLNHLISRYQLPLTTHICSKNTVLYPTQEHEKSTFSYMNLTK